MKNTPVNRDLFLSSLNNSKKCYLKKPRSWQKIWFWWEDSDKWFMNISYESRKGNKIVKEESSWITANDLDSRISFYLNEGYELYAME